MALQSYPTRLKTCFYTSALSLSLQLRKKHPHANHTIWQDVYRPRTAAGDVYLKLTVLDDVLIVSFKEL